MKKKENYIISVTFIFVLALTTFNLNAGMAFWEEGPSCLDTDVQNTVTNTFADFYGTCVDTRGEDHVAGPLVACQTGETPIPICTPQTCHGYTYCQSNTGGPPP